MLLRLRVHTHLAPSASPLTQGCGLEDGAFDFLGPLSPSVDRAGLRADSGSDKAIDICRLTRAVRTWMTPPFGLQRLHRTNLQLFAFSVYVGGYARYAELLGQVGGGVAIRGARVRVRRPS